MSIITPKITGDEKIMVTGNHFGGNSLWHLDDINEQFTKNVETLGVGPIRWPGGSISEQRFDPANPDEPLDVPRGYGTQSTMEMDVDKVLTFTEAAQFAHDTGRGMSIVLPVRAAIEETWDEDGNHSFTISEEGLDDIRAFVEEALTDGGKYPDFTVLSFEIGNEYWGTPLSSKEYGVIADAIIKKVSEGIEASGTEQDPKILVQVGAPWAEEFEDDNEFSDLSWSEKIKKANADIISGLSQRSRDLVDGIIEHKYMDDNGELKYSSWEADTIKDLWADAGMSVPLNYTEWNTRKISESKDSMVKSGRLIEMFEHMLRDGAESNYIWPIHQSTNNDLAGKAGSGPGHMSVNGAAFKLMADNIQGMSWSELSMENDASIESSFYHDKDSFVLFLSNSTGKQMEHELDLSSLLESKGLDLGSGVVSVTEISRDEAQDEHVGKGQGARLSTNVSVLDKASQNLTIAPWQTLMIKVEGGDAALDEGLLLGGSDGDDVITGSSGNDVLVAEDGDDVLRGGEGDDLSLTGEGSDTVKGGEGRDVIVLGNDDDYEAASGKKADVGDLIIVSGTQDDGEAQISLAGGGNTILLDGNASCEITGFTETDVIGLNAVYSSKQELIESTKRREDGSLTITLPSGAVVALIGYSGSAEELGDNAFDFRQDAAEIIAEHTSGLSADQREIAYEELVPVGKTVSGENVWKDLKSNAPDKPDVPDAPPPAPDPDDGEEETEQKEDGSGGGCFVATAAYGHRMHPDVIALRRFRDAHLVRYAAGRAFIRFYWVIGPALASRVKSDSRFAKSARSILSGLVNVLRRSGLTQNK